MTPQDKAMQNRREVYQTRTWLFGHGREDWKSADYLGPLLAISKESSAME
jgi:hypothetical protein